MAAQKEAELPLIKPDATAGEKLRGRERSAASLRSLENVKRSGSRSLSPMRVSDIILNPETPSKSTDRKVSVSSSSFLSSFSLPKGSRKWRIRDLLLFRSASEGRVTEKQVKNSSFQNPDLNDPQLVVFGLWAYDARALGMAVKQIGTTNFTFQNPNLSDNVTDLETLGVSQNGRKLRDSLSNTKFRGLTGDFSIEIQNPFAQKKVHLDEENDNPNPNPNTKPFYF